VLCLTFQWARVTVRTSNLPRQFFQICLPVQSTPKLNHSTAVAEAEMMQLISACWLFGAFLMEILYNFPDESPLGSVYLKLICYGGHRTLVGDCSSNGSWASRGTEVSAASYEEAGSVPFECH